MYAHVLVCAGCLFPLIVRIFMYCWYGFFIAIHRLKFNGAIIKWNSLLHVIMLTIAINRYTLIWATATAATLITKPNWTSSRFFMNKNVRSFNDAASTHIVLLINVINKYKFAQRRGSHNQLRTNARTYQHMNVFRSIDSMQKRSSFYCKWKYLLCFEHSHKHSAHNALVMFNNDNYHACALIPWINIQFLCCLNIHWWTFFCTI